VIEPLITATGGDRKMPRKRKFTDAQISVVLNEIENGAKVEDLCRKLGVSDATIYNWKKRYSGLQAPEIKKLRQLEEENGKLKRVAADLTLDKIMLQDVLSKKL
jgi:putative transposase